MAGQIKINKVLFITLTNIGDVVLTLPSLDYLKQKFPDACFTVLSGPNASILFSGDPQISENITYDKHIPFREKFALFNRLRKEKFDVIIDLRDTAIRWLTQAKYKNPYIIHVPKNITHLRLRHLYKTLAAFGETDKISGIKIPAQSIFLDDSVNISAGELLKKYNISLDSEYIIVAPGARSQTKRWLRQSFIKLCHELSKHYSVVLMGDENDSVITKDINRHLRDSCIDLGSQTSLLEAIAIIKRAKLVICNDSAFLQLSSYLNIPTLAIFGPTDENKYGPYSKLSAVLRKNTLCTPCQKDDCKNNWLCMLQVSHLAVAEAAFALLQGKVPKLQSNYRRILITRTDRLGDVLLSTPVIKNLRDNLPSAYIAMMVKESLVDLVKDNPYLDEVIPFDKKGRHKGMIKTIRFSGELKKRNFDLALILHPTVRVHLILFLSGIKKRIGYDKKFGFLNTHILKHKKQFGEKHESEYTLDFLREIGIVPSDRKMFMPVYQDSEDWVLNLISERRLGDSKIVVMHCQASCPSRLWPQDNCEYLIDKIIKTYKANIIYVGVQEDKNVKEKEGVINLTGKTSIAQLASIINHSHLLISNDSGPVHIAVALGKPVISIFGRNQPGLSPKRWGHSNETSVFLHKQVGCEVCLAHDCQKGFACLKAIRPEEVLSYVDKFLSI